MKKITILFLLIFCSLGMGMFGQTSQPADSNILPPSENREFVWVIFDTDSLFTLHASIGPFSAAERAKTIDQRLKQLDKDIDFVKDSFNIRSDSIFSTILYKDFAILSMTNQDARGTGMSRAQLADHYKQIVETSFHAYKEANSLEDWLINIGITLALLAGLILILYLINRLWKWINIKLINYEKGLKRKRKSMFRYLAPKGPEYFFVFLAKLVKWALIIIILFLYLPLLFSYIPYTKGLVYQFYGYIMEPLKAVFNGFVNFLPNLFFIIVIFLVARYIVRVMSYIGKEIEQEKIKFKGFHKEWAKPTINIFKIIIYAFAVVFMFPYIPGSGSDAFKGVSIFLGVLFSLGSTSAIANIVAGIVITYMRPFSIGDRVRIGDTMGDVVSKSMLVTKVRTLKNEDVTIPNATIINTHLWNFSSNAKELGIILHTSVTIGYDVPWEKVNKLLLEAAKNTEGLTREPKPFVLQKGLNDFYVEYELNVYTKQPGKMAMFYSELHRNILMVFNKAEIEILSPHYNAIRDGNESTIPGVADTKNPVEKIIDNLSGKKA